MSDKAFVFIFVSKKSGKIIYIKKSLEFEYFLKLDNVEVYKLSASGSSYKKNDNYKSNYLEKMFESLEEQELLESKISTLILLKSNLELTKKSMADHFTELGEIAFENIETVNLVNEISEKEQVVLRNRLDALFLNFEIRVNEFKTLNEVNAFYGEITNSLVIGSYSRVNKIKETGYE